MTSTCDVCIIEDDPNDLKLVQRVLDMEGYSNVVAVDGRSGWDAISANHPRVILADWEMPHCDGLELCRRVRATPDLKASYFVMLTSRGDESAREKAFQCGVDDYLVKPFDRATLVARVRVGVRMWEANAYLQRAAITDGLTGLYNHDHLTTVIDRELHRARRYGNRLALIMLDLDHFKAVNDTFGHLVGNETLMEVARVLRETVRDFDTIGRFGGEEFVVVAPEATLEDALTISERIRVGISRSVRVEALRGHIVTASLGVATADDARVRSATDLVDLADRALYAAKNAGRNNVKSAVDLQEDELLSIRGEEVESLRKRVAILSVQAKDVYIQTVSSLVQALEEKDPFTARHSVNVSAYCKELATEMGLGEAAITAISNAGLLHDLGKVGIPDRILMKPTGLSETEALVMKQVPSISVRILDHLRILDEEMQIIRYQREFFDGTGYPEQLAGDQIPIGSRILLVANAFDAMTTDRVYRPCRNIDEAIEDIKRHRGTQFDPDVVDALCRSLANHRELYQSRVRTTSDALRSPAGVL